MKLVHTLMFLCFWTKPSRIKVSPKNVTIYLLENYSSTLTPADISCDGINRFEDIDTFYLYDLDTMERIIHFIKKANPYPKNNIDARGNIYINYQSGKTDSVCISSTPFFLLNGKGMMLPDDSLFYILNLMQYKLHG